MRRNIVTCILLLLFSCTGVLKAQDKEVSIGLRTGHKASFGRFDAISAEARGIINENIILHGGAQYSSIGKVAAEARPSYFHDFGWGCISGEAILSYTVIASINSFAVGAGAGFSSKWLSARLGYYYHIFGGKGGQIEEPFNIYYEFCINLIPMIEKWDLKLTATNNEIFELDRHYQPTFSTTCSYFPRQDFGIHMRIGCKPAGMFHMSADYYESYLSLTVCYRW